jgi:hypothetical protein
VASGNVAGNLNSEFNCKLVQNANINWKQPLVAFGALGIVIVLGSVVIEEQLWNILANTLSVALGTSGR